MQEHAIRSKSGVLQDLGPTPLRSLLSFADPRLPPTLDSGRILRFVYIGRLSLSAAIFLAAVLIWDRAATTDTLVASLTFVIAMLFTAGSWMYDEVYGRPLGRTFFYLQSLCDLFVVTAVVHVTGGITSQFVALYILVIASAALLLPIGGGLLIAILGNLLYFADSIWGQDTVLEAGTWLQLGVFGIVALGSAVISARLQEAGVEKADLAAELTMVRLQAADILQNIHSGIITVDAHGALLYANPIASTLLGIDLDDALGKPMLARIGAIAPSLSAALARTIHEGVRTSRAEGLVETAGHVFPIGVTTTYAEGDGRTIGKTVTAIFQDISDQKQLESLHLRAERLEAVAELSASLAHEIRNPLASIRSAVEQISKFPRASDDERTLGALIVRESDRLSRLLNEFLDFARVRVTRISLVDIAALAREAAHLGEAHADRQAGVRIVCRAPDEPLIIDGDEDLLHRAIFNLVLNALQATPPGGLVTIEAELLAGADLPAVGIPSIERCAVALRVSDTGAGIPHGIRERMFDPFITTKPGGSGLGLPVVHRAIEAHHGVVVASENPEGGTRFTVLLPCSQSDNGDTA